MDNYTAFFLALILVIVAAVDGVFFDWALTLGIGHLLVRLSNWLAFWRNI